jgi:hypothetical protein
VTEFIGFQVWPEGAEGEVTIQVASLVRGGHPGQPHGQPGNAREAGSPGPEWGGWGCGQAHRGKSAGDCCDEPAITVLVMKGCLGVALTVCFRVTRTFSGQRSARRSIKLYVRNALGSCH